MVSQHGDAAGLANLVAMLSRLKAVPWHRAEDKQKLLGALWGLLRPRLSEATPRHCVEAMLAASRLGAAPPGLHEECVSAFARALHDNVPGSAEPRLLSNASYAIATAPSSAVRDACRPLVEDVLLPAFMVALPEASAQSVANTAYAAALLGASSFSVPRLLANAPRDAWRGATPQARGECADDEQPRGHNRMPHLAALR
jgi:hypothetical protein